MTKWKRLKQSNHFSVSIANNQHSHSKWFHCLINNYGHEMTINGNIIEHITFPQHSQFKRKSNRLFHLLCSFRIQSVTASIIEDYSTHHRILNSMATGIPVYVHTLPKIIIVRTVKREIIKFWTRQMASEYRTESLFGIGYVWCCSNQRTNNIKDQEKFKWNEVNDKDELMLFASHTNCRYWERCGFGFIEKRDGKPVYTWSMTLVSHTDSVYITAHRQTYSTTILYAVVSVWIYIH